MRSFVIIESSRSGEVTLSFTDVGTSCPCREFLTPQICLLTLVAKIKFSRKFPDLQCIKLQFALTTFIVCAFKSSSDISHESIKA